MGDINPSKMPGKKTITRKDDPNKVEMFKRGGKTNWIKEAIGKPGALRKELGAKEGQPIPAKKLAAAAKKSGKLGKRARLAETLKGLKK
jgi:hypothetical protein